MNKFTHWAQEPNYAIPSLLHSLFTENDTWKIRTDSLCYDKYLDVETVSKSFFPPWNYRTRFTHNGSLNWKKYSFLPLLSSLILPDKRTTDLESNKKSILKTIFSH